MTECWIIVGCVFLSLVPNFSFISSLYCRKYFWLTILFYSPSFFVIILHFINAQNISSSATFPKRQREWKWAIECLAITFSARVVQYFIYMAYAASCLVVVDGGMHSLKREKQLYLIGKRHCVNNTDLTRFDSKVHKNLLHKEQDQTKLSGRPWGS